MIPADNYTQEEEEKPSPPPPPANFNDVFETMWTKFVEGK